MSNGEISFEAARRLGDAEGEEYAVHFDAVNPRGAGEETYRAVVPYFESELRPILPSDQDGRIVEIGSGHGHLVRYLVENGYRRVGAVDRSHALLDAVKAALGERLEFTCVADGFEFLVDNPNRFSGIILFDVLEHVPPRELHAAARRAFQALRPGGRLIVRTPNMASLFGAYSRYLDLTHHHGFTELSLFQLLRGAGFREPRLLVPKLHGTRAQRRRQRFLRWLQRKLIAWQDRTVPRCVDKNLIVWAERDA